MDKMHKRLLVLAVLLSTLLVAGCTGGGGGDAGTMSTGTSQTGGPETLSGETFSVSDYEGQYVVMEFYSGCIRCIKQTKELRNLDEQKGSDVALVSISSMSVQEAKKFRDENGGDWTFVHDPGRGLASEYGVTGDPSIKVLSPAGEVVYESVGITETSEILSSIESHRQG